jgi:phosphonate transport system substrate-binding protein
MSYVMSVSPDFNVKNITGWFVFNTWLQKQLGENIHFELFDKFNEQHKAIADNKINMIYANPYDAAMLVREHGFQALVRPINKADEALIAVKADSPIKNVEDLKPGAIIATTDDPDVHMMCMIMIEPADLNKDNVTINSKDGYVVVAKELLRGTADAGFFLADTFDELSDVIKSQLRVLVRSQIHVINHVFLIDKSLAARRDDITAALLSMSKSDNGKRILSEIGIPDWEKVEEEDVEFMIDLMSTLVS